MVKITQLEIENIKRVKACTLSPEENGLTIIGGKNGQGKTSVLDAIAWTLGGNKFKPSNPYRESSVLPPSLHVELSNGLIVERKGKNSELKVIDPNGNKSGQQLLNEFIEELALNLPKFMQASEKEKANILLQIIGVGDKLHELETEEQRLYNERYAIGRIADQKKKYAAELAYYPDVPPEPVSASELIMQQQEILARNGENQKKRNAKEMYARKVKTLEEELRVLSAKLEEARAELSVAERDANDLIDESTEELERNISMIEAINIKVRANLDKERAEQEAEAQSKEYDELTCKLNTVRQKKQDLLNNAELPLPELSVEDGELTYKGHKWDCMSGAEQLKVGTAIVRAINPRCGFVLLDKLEQMDTDTLQDFGQWLETEGLQAIATRVSTGDECSIIISDGFVKELHEEKAARRAWKAGEF